jgi:hypothetical protein
VIGVHRILSILVSVIVALLVAAALLLPAQQQRDMHILPGNGWTHVSGAWMQWTNNGTFGPGFNWNRTEYGRYHAWLVHDQAVGGTRTFTRIDDAEFLVYAAGSAVAGILSFILIRCVFRTRNNGA